MRGKIHDINLSTVDAKTVCEVRLLLLALCFYAIPLEYYKVIYVIGTSFVAVLLQCYDLNVFIYLF